MKAMGYIRVSTEEQAREGVSLENQKARIRSYCEYKGFELADIVEDAGVSGGKNAAREGFMALLGAIEGRDFDVLVIYSLERLSRDMLTMLALERLLDEYDIELHTVEGQIDTGTPDGWMSFAMKSFLGEMERRQVKSRTKKAMAYKKSQQNVVGSVPYGSDRQGEMLVQNSAEQNVITRVNGMYVTGMTLSAICRELSATGAKSRAGTDFSVMQVKRMIADYTDVFHRKATSTGTAIAEFIKRAA